MARTSGEDAKGPLRSGNGPPAESRDQLVQALHYLSNNLHSLTLRLFVLQSSNPSSEARIHIDAAHRLAGQSVTLIEQIHALIDPSPAPKPQRPTPPRRPR